jgi:hypothetical protein
MGERKVYLSGAEKTIVAGLGHHVYTVQFLEEWLNREDHVFTNAPAALQCTAAWGFYAAVQQMVKAGGHITYKPHGVNKKGGKR